MEFRKNFASDNNAGTSPEVLQYLEKVNRGHVVGYGDDEFTQSAIQKFKQLFGDSADIFFVFNGTAANVLSLKSMVRSHQAVVCTDVAHILVDECGAPEHFTGAKLIPLYERDGKLKPGHIKPLLHVKGVPHHSQPGAISITQVTELGTIYTPEEIKKLCDFAHRNHMLVHLDGARLANAVAALNISLKEMLVDTGVDIVSFGGTKNGLMAAEAVVILNKALLPNFPYIRKQGMQLASKMRFIAAQFLAYFDDDLWLRNASNANRMAKILEEEVRRISDLQITQPVEANGLFVRVPERLIKPLQEEYFFYMWDEGEHIVRWMTSFDTDETDIQNFIKAVKKYL